jgi:hypothetical protein
MKEEPVVTRRRGLACQVCVPADWSDKAVLAFAERDNPCGTMNGWAIRREGHPDLKGAAERVQCQQREGYCHIMLDA